MIVDCKSAVMLSAAVVVIMPTLDHPKKELFPQHHCVSLKANLKLGLSSWLHLITTTAVESGTANLVAYYVHSDNCFIMPYKGEI